MSWRSVLPGWPLTKVSSPSLGPLRIKLQKIVDLRRLPIFVNAKDANIEIVTRVFEIVRVAAVKRDLLLRRENEPYVVVTFVAIEMIGAALIQA